MMVLHSPFALLSSSPPERATSQTFNHHGRRNHGGAAQGDPAVPAGGRAGGRARKVKVACAGAGVLSLPSLPHALPLSRPPAPPQRAEEIDRVEPKMAYYCRMHAVEQVRKERREESLSQTSNLAHQPRHPHLTHPHPISISGPRPRKPVRPDRRPARGVALQAGEGQAGLEAGQPSRRRGRVRDFRPPRLCPGR